ncbi:MAG TPA: RpiB/LacA/LacB family sugar-phosphate isomerase [Candidatus Acidoferrales bacterium]|nr:RpiB/LacA/LacB family sugar-phosphate isomerase [Candidatus Acidoferrales bacterium]
MRLAIAADHAGVSLKQIVAEACRAWGHDLTDLGGNDASVPDDYPDRALALGRTVASGECERGVLICGSGVGASVAANKITGVRAGLCHDTYSAHQGVEHDNMNVLCLGSRVIGPALALELVHAFVMANFSGEERHVRRLAKVQAIEATHGAE